MRDWGRPDAGVDKHQARALTWYMLALTVAIIYVVVNVRRVKRNRSRSQRCSCCWASLPRPWSRLIGVFLFMPGPRMNYTCTVEPKLVPEVALRDFRRQAVAAAVV